MAKRLFNAVFMLVLLAAVVLAFDATRFFKAPLHNTRGRSVAVEPGMSFQAIARRLHEQGIIEHARDVRYLSAYARLSGAASRIKTGEYVVPARQTPRRLVSLLVSGKTRQHRLTLVEGRRFVDIRAALAGDAAIDHKLAGKSNAQIMAAIGHPGEKPEGRFMPDTYMFPRGTTDIAFLARAYDSMQAYLDKAWNNRADDIAVDSPYQALILASIVEKETAVPAERTRIAGVFSRRLDQGMRLQTDPSVIYGIPDYDGNITRADLTRNTPYNTYTRAGLPPTPIATPSRQSIHAVLHPASGKALYFVARGDGTHKFSDTLAEHNRAVAKFQRGS